MNALEKLAEELLALYDEREANTIARWAAEDILGKNTENPPPQLLDFWQSAQKRLLNGEPLAYVTGKTNFYGFDFLVSPDVLVPRPETEELVHWIFSDWKKSPAPKIMDVGTGSGCIAITLQKLMPQSSVSALDTSEKALAIARTNAEKLRAEVTFLQLDFLNSSLQEMVDVIVSNPPYIDPETERKEISPRVMQHEPHLALFSPPHDPLAFYRRLAEEALTKLRPKGALYAEMNALRALETADLFERAGFIIEVRKDLSGKDRMIKCQKADQQAIFQIP
jgi:release factor glutamine methyltransferase